MSNELIIPEIVILNELEKSDNSLSPVLWEDKRNQLIEMYDKDKDKSEVYRAKKRMFMSDFVNRIIDDKLIVCPQLPQNVLNQLYRLYLYCCQQAVFCNEVRRNPFILGFHVLTEMKMALVAMFISYRLINPQCPYSWDKAFFYKNINVDKTADGNTTIDFYRIGVQDIIAAINEEIITDWFIYREHDHNGVKTLMDIKNNLLQLPDYIRGGDPVSEFSRFERKMQEEKNRVQNRKNEALDIEVRKVMVQKIAQEAADELLASGLNKKDLLNKIFNDDLASLLGMDNSSDNVKPSNTSLFSSKKTVAPVKEEKKLLKQDTKKIEGVILQFLDEE